MSDSEMSPSEQDMAYEAQQDAARKERIEQFGFDVLDQSLWKTFNSKKQVKSVPMTRGIYNKYQGWETPKDENLEDEGYLIEYLDGGKPNHPDHEGYISWSPKEVFDRNHVPLGRGESPYLVHVDESPFIHVPSLIIDIKDENFSRVFGDFASGCIEGLHVTNVDNIPAEEFAKIYAEAATARRFIKVEIDPNDPDQMASAELLKTMAKTKEMSLSGAYRQPRGLIAGLPMVDEASFYPNGVPMSIYKSKPLGNGLALGTVETLSGPNGKLDFSDALRALKFGYRVQRSGWNGKDMWLSVSNLNTATVPADKFWSPHNSEYAKNNGGSAEVPPCITMKNAKGQIQMGWAPSPEDMFCSDWFVFEKQDEFSGTDDIATMTEDTETFASKSEPVNIHAKLNGMETKFWSRDKELRELAADFPDAFNSILVHKTLTKTTVGKTVGELLTFETPVLDNPKGSSGFPCVITNCKNGAKIEMEQEDSLITATFFAVNGSALSNTYRKHNAGDRGALLLKAYYTLFPTPELGPYIEPGQRFQFDCADANFVKVRDQLERFLDNGARATHGPHRDGMYEVQMGVMSLLTKILDTYGSDIGEHGEVLTNLSFAEALMFTESGFEIRHESWKPDDKLTPTLSDMEYVFMRTGEETPWVATDEELRSDGWILLYKED